MFITLEESARELFEVAPIVMREALSEMHSRRLPDLTVPPFRTRAFIGNRLHSKVIS
jgi:hypothetical protein